jgi:hypothetical protein
LRELQLVWGWASDFRVRSFLKVLENERMIERTKNAAKTQITICNYSLYQDVERKENAEETQKETQGKRTKGTSKQDNIKLSSFHSDNLKPEKPKITSEQILDICLEPETTQAVLEHRKAIKKPLTPRSAQMLVDAFRESGNVELAAKTMILRGWQGFDPEWMKKPALQVFNSGQTDDIPKDNGPMIPLEGRRPAPEKTIIALVDVFKKTGNWLDQFGPPPGKPGCIIPEQYLSNVIPFIASG